MNIPSIILKRMALTFLVGASCFLVSLAVFFFANDIPLLWLGIFLFLMCLMKCFLLFFKGLTGAYFLLEGECCYARRLPFSKYQHVTILDPDGESHCLQLESGIKITPGCHYRLYFAENPQGAFSGKYRLLHKAEASGNFWGIELLPDENALDI